MEQMNKGYYQSEIVTMPKRSLKKPTQKVHPAGRAAMLSHVRLVRFPQARGRTVDMVELSLDSDFQCVSIRFKDNTDLTVVIDTGLTSEQNIPSGRRETRRFSSAGLWFAATGCDRFCALRFAARWPTAQGRTFSLLIRHE